MGRLRGLLREKQLVGWFPVWWGMEEPALNAVSRKDFWKRRNTRAPLSFADGGCRKSCLGEITARSRNGEKNRRKNARVKIDVICWRNSSLQTGVIPSASRGIP